jgi:CHAT domain-containing protein
MPLPILQRIISQNSANKSVALGVLYASQAQSFISPTQALSASFGVLQQSASSAAGEAISKLAARFAAGTNELAQLVRKDQDLTAEADRLDKSIVAAVSKPPAQRNTSAENQFRHINEIKSERDELRHIFIQQYPDYVALSKPQPLTIEQTQALLADDEALVTIDLNKKSYVWAITKDRAEWRQLSVSSDEVYKTVATLRRALSFSRAEAFDTDLAYRLYRQLLEPVEDILSDKTRLSFVLSGALTSLPPQVLITSDPKGKDLAAVDWLVRKYSIAVLPSVASLKTLRERRSAVAAVKPLIGFGDPIFDATAQRTTKPKLVTLDWSLPGFYRGVGTDTKALGRALPALPETADELSEVAKTLGAKPEDIKLGNAATVSNVKHLSLTDYRVVYFATHALVAGEADEFTKVRAEPALVLSIPEKPSEEDDGLLRASDVAMLKMNAEFVVLSACNTAAGDAPGAEALSGLARAFFLRGGQIIDCVELGG